MTYLPRARTERRSASFGIADVPERITGLAWSPNGKQIIFDSPHGRVQGVYAVNADGSNFREVAQTGGTLTEWTE
ncbi:TolB-like translocation protein [Streptomyces gibsoniae]|uniref:Uncharacterized protein n=1 Tax=Streptomyces gibsoniae TaxID=3075529 RepID=A0ABU2UAQ1_9ACTN|nr:hypothetical protein [Streptomyces sp. DSM 41699]MDT0470250.1 hypothetical protein [Streptomyces sp. DSM 41699]